MRCVYIIYTCIHIFGLYGICGEPHHLIVRDQNWRTLLTPRNILHPTNHTRNSSAQPQWKGRAEGEWGKQKGQACDIKCQNQGLRLLRKKKKRKQYQQTKTIPTHSNMVQILVEQWLNHLQLLGWPTRSWYILELKQIKTSGHHLTQLLPSYTQQKPTSWPLFCQGLISLEKVQKVVEKKTRRCSHRCAAQHVGFPEWIRSLNREQYSSLYNPKNHGFCHCSNIRKCQECKTSRPDDFKSGFPDSSFIL